MSRSFLASPVLAAIALLGCLSISPRPAFAARAGTVDADGVDLREGPGPNFKSLDKLPKGSSVAASNQPIDGYFKIRTAAGLIGFVPADALVLQPVPSDDAPAAPGEPPKASASAPVAAAPPESSRSKSKHSIHVKVLSGYNFFSVGDVNTLLNANVLLFGYSAGAEIDFPLTSDLALVVRMERVFKSVQAQDGKTNNVFNMSLSSYPLMAGLNMALTNNGKWSSHISLMGGVGLLTDLSSVDLSLAAPNTTDMSQMAIAGLSAIDLTYSFNRTWSVFAEAGYRYLQTAQIVPGVAENGSQIFESPNTSTFVPVSLNLSGPFVGAGVGASF